MKFQLPAKLLWLVAIVLGSCEDAAEYQRSTQPPNIIMIMMDDMGQSDIGAFGAEWDTPNIDSFIKSSITLSHHYVGYVCSASRSQFLTGRYSFHNGFARQYPFDRGEIGGTPLGVPTIANYLKEYSDYQTYAIGKWQLGGAINEQLPMNRGFDYFYGFLGGFEDYYTKSTNIWSTNSDPKYIQQDSTEYLDFWENYQAIDSTSNMYSTTLYGNKIIEIIGNHWSKNTRETESDISSNSNDETTKTSSKEKETEENVFNSNPFFIYVGFQANHIPFSESSEFYDKCRGLYSDELYGMDEIDLRDGACESMVGVDDVMGKIVRYLKELDVWDNTLIIFTSDNGGSISEGGCNYPLRGGKNTYFEGNQRVVTFVGGGVIEQAGRDGIVLNGLFSNVDWVPTLLSFADILPAEYNFVSFNNGAGDGDDIGSDVSDISDDSDSKLPISLDGYNMYDYLMNEDSRPLRDHVMFTMVSTDEDSNNENENENDNENGKDNEILIKKQLEEHDLSQLALIFFDDDGILWKYFYTEASTNPLGGLTENAGWCRVNSNSNSNSHSSHQQQQRSKYTIETVSESCDNGIFDITNDLSEEQNLLDIIDSDKLNLLQSIVDSKLDYYLNNEMNENSDYISISYDCLFERRNILAYPKLHGGVWAPFLAKEEFDTIIKDDCGLDENDLMFELHTGNFELPQGELISFVSNANWKIEQLNTRVNEITDEFTIDIHGNEFEVNHDRGVVNGGKRDVSKSDDDNDDGKENNRMLFNSRDFFNSQNGKNKMVIIIGYIVCVFLLIAAIVFWKMKCMKRESQTKSAGARGYTPIA